MTYGRLGDLFVLLRCPEQLQGTSREFNAQLETASYQKMKDWRTLLIQYLLQQNRSVTVQNSVLYVNLVSVVDCSVLNWVEQKELRGLASDDRLFRRVAEPGSMLMDFDNNFKCRMGGEDLSHVQFNPKL